MERVLAQIKQYGEAAINNGPYRSASLAPGRRSSATFIPGRRVLQRCPERLFIKDSVQEQRYLSKARFECLPMIITPLPMLL